MSLVITLHRRRTRTLPGLLAAAACLQGCATVTSGTTQSVSVQTFQGSAEIFDARCTLVAGRRAPVFVTTPGTVPVRRGGKPLVVSCRKDDVGTGVVGFEPTTSNLTAGNLLFGTSVLIALPIDFMTGAAYRYPELLRIELVRPPTAPPSAGEDERAASPRPED